MAQRWEIIGGGEKGSIVVREDRKLSSPEASQRLSTGSVVEEVELLGERLHFRLVSGTGPAQGWVSVTVKGKELARRLGSKDEGQGKEKMDPYKVLGIPPDATDAAIKSAFRKASLKVHPDRNPDPEAAAQFRQLTEAKDFLLHPLKRMLYNMTHGHVAKRHYEAWWSDWDEIFGELELDEDEPEQLDVPRSLPSADARTDVLVFGATGIVGTLACSVMQRYMPSRTWAIAGRNGRKLELLEAKFGKGPLYRGHLRLESPDDIERIVRTARVVVDMSGPKFLMGHAVAEACVRTGTHYLEITGFGGDTLVTKAAFEELGPKAKAAGVSLVYFCGVACVQTDIASLLLVQHLREQHGLPTRRVDSYEIGQNSRLNGSVILSARGPDNYEKRLKQQGYFFLGGVPGDGLKPEDDESKAKPVQDKYAGMWANITEIPEPILVRCSAGLFQDTQPYGNNFRYMGWQLYPDRAAAEINALRTQNMFLRRGYDKHLALNKLPGQGHGPCERFRKEAVYTRIFVAEAEAAGAEREGPTAHCIISPGPGGLSDFQEGTAVVALEAADCFLSALDARPSAVRPGIGTPAYHLAHLGLAGRLNARIGLKLVDGPPASSLFQNAMTSAAPLTA